MARLKMLGMKNLFRKLNRGITECIIILMFLPTVWPMERRIPKSRVRAPEVNYRQAEKKILDNILGPAVYDNRMRPNGINTTDGPTIVNVNLYVRSFEKIDDVKMEFSVQITFRQQWNDNRLAFNNMEGKIKYLTMTDRAKVWMPDTFFRNEKEGKFHKIIQPNLYVRVFPNGDILYSIRISLTLSCPMNLRLFPLDTQSCALRVASYGWTMDDLIYKWKDPDPVQFVKDIFLPGGFEQGNSSHDYCNAKTNTGHYSCLTVDMTFKRQLSYYVVTIYVPTFMIVCVSWFSFWLDHKSAPARVALTVTTLLAMSTTTSSINNSLPPVAYTKAIDVWSNICVSFVFLALLEYALVNYAARADTRNAVTRMGLQKELEHAEREAAANPEEPVYDQDPFDRMCESALKPSRKPLLFAELLPRSRSRHNHNVRSVLDSWPAKPGAKKIDVISRVLFPATFAGLNVIYWSFYLTRKDSSTMN